MDEQYLERPDNSPEYQQPCGLFARHLGSPRPPPQGDQAHDARQRCKYQHDAGRDGLSRWLVRSGPNPAQGRQPDVDQNEN